MLTAALLTLVGCSPDLKLVRLDVGEDERSYFDHAPDTLEDGAPVVLVFHGEGTGARLGRDIAELSGYSEVADANSFLAVYPNSKEGVWNDTTADGTTKHNSVTDVDDVAFVDDLLADIEERHNIDYHRIYAVGFSNGGLFVQRLMCERAHSIAAGGSIAANMPVNLADDCDPDRGANIIFMVGTEDRWTPFNGGAVLNDGGEVLSANDSVMKWSALNQCEETPSQAEYPDIDQEDGSTVNETQWSNCKDDSFVRYLRIDGGGHTWPGRKQSLPRNVVGNVNNDIDGAWDSWNSFKDVEISIDL